MMLVPWPFPTIETRSRYFLWGWASAALVQLAQSFPSSSVQLSISRRHHASTCSISQAQFRSMLNFETLSRKHELTIALNRKMSIQCSASHSLGDEWPQRTIVALCLTMVAPNALILDHKCRWWRAALLVRETVRTPVGRPIPSFLVRPPKHSGITRTDRKA